MKKVTFILLLLFLHSFTIKSQIQTQWQQSYGGTGNDVLFSVCQTADGGYIAVGYTESTDGDVTGSHGETDCWIMKLDAYGSMQWKKCYGGSSWDEAYSIIQTSDGGYAFISDSESTNGDVIGNHGMTDIWIVKLDSEGNIQWKKAYGGTDFDEAIKLVQTSDGGYVFSGYTYSNDGDITGNHGNFDFWIVKINSIGDIQWQRVLGGSFWDSVYSFIQTLDGGYIMVGETESNNGDVTNFHGNSDYWVVKLDSDGNLEWQNTYGGTLTENATSVIQNSDGSYFVSGQTTSSDIDVTDNHGNNDIWLIKLDPNGTLLWQKCYGGSYDDNGPSLVSLPQNNNILMAGITLSNDGDIIGNHGNYDIWFLKLDSSGNILWQSCFGGTNSDIISSIMNTTDNGYILGGTAYSTNGDATGTPGGCNFWMAKLIDPNISGRVFNDENHDGILDTGEQGVANHIVRLTPGPLYTVTNNDGYFFYKTDTGDYSINYIAQQYWYLTTSNNYNLSIESSSQFIDSLKFGVKSKANVNDVSISIIGTSTRAGFNSDYWLSYKNLGSNTTSGTISFKYDSLLTFGSSSLPPVLHTGNILEFEYNSLGPGVQRLIRIGFQVPGVQNLGDTLNNYAQISPLIADTNIINNYDTLFQIITGSYDPNNKEVTPTGYGQQGMILHGQRLTYTIHFQNTGTDTAFTILLRDTIDTDLDLSSFMLESSSHPVQLSIHNGNELQFRFNNILLPDSNVNEPESNGFVRYSISPKTNLVDGVTVNNTAYIFFDFNPAIVTNTTLNTYVTNIPVLEPVLQMQKYLVKTYPNPTHDIVFINLPEYTSKVEIFNLNGELIQQIATKSEVLQINVKDLPVGTYALKIYCNKNVVSSKFLKE